jgi:nucleoside-diphosphate-sugar epimerase
VHTHVADRSDQEATRAALGGLEPDAVVNFVAFTPDQVQADIDLFTGRTGQYVFISSASAYQTPPASLPVTESTPLANPFWQYSRDKIACEDLLLRAYREDGFPMTVVRPSHTYDETLLPFTGGWTVVERMRQGREVVVHGDGTSLWTLTHSRDVAPGLVGLLGKHQAVGHAFHITREDALAWNTIYELVGAAAGVRRPRLVHVPSDAVAAADPRWGAGLLGDKAHSMVFDNTKIKRLVPEFRPTTSLEEGAREVVAWYDADPARRTVDAAHEAVEDALVERFRV